MTAHFKYTFLLTAVMLAGCKSEYPDVPAKYHSLLNEALAKSGNNSEELINALNSVPASQKEAMAYLISYMPDYDLTTISSGLLTDNVTYAYIAREKYDWCRELPDSVFFNEVLPYHNVTEERDNWRKEFYERFSPYVDECSDIRDAVYAINKNVREELQVEYSTQRRVSDQGPFESMETKIASCTGLTILLNDAFRSVGIPCRFAGTPNWFDNRGNHSWNEVLIDGEWYFTEYYMDDLNKTWFVTDAAKATAGSVDNGIFAISYKPTGNLFPMVWDEAKPVNAIEVTPRYLEICSSSLKKKNNRVNIDIEVYSAKGYDSESDNRIPASVTIFCGDKQIKEGITCSPVNDLNNYLSVSLDPETEYTIISTYETLRKEQKIRIGKDNIRIKIIMD